MAVLSRGGAHSEFLELALGRMNIPFAKRGAMRFADKRHGSDFAAFLKVARNPARFPSLALVAAALPGAGLKTAGAVARRAAGYGARAAPIAKGPFRSEPPGRAALGLLPVRVCRGCDGMGDRPGLVFGRDVPLLKRLYKDDWTFRQGEVESVRGMAEASGRLSAFLSSFLTGPPEGTPGGESAAAVSPGPRGRRDAAVPGGDLALGTNRSAKWLEWTRVFVISAAVDRLHSCLAKGKPEEPEQERRLFNAVVAKAKDTLAAYCPLEREGQELPVFQGLALPLRQGRLVERGIRFLGGVRKGGLSGRWRRRGERRARAEAPLVTARGKR
ncbi:MAG: hypothetical protein LBQ12_10460 [Deltaproteobacteria bacterium]|jgi:superfamily I DNA/RNA helicase|nr:hypothetical protein [Deltaproteobacteria bacterium]